MDGACVRKISLYFVCKRNGPSRGAREEPRARCVSSKKARALKSDTLFHLLGLCAQKLTLATLTSVVGCSRTALLDDDEALARGQIVDASAAASIQDGMAGDLGDAIMSDDGKVADVNDEAKDDSLFDASAVVVGSIAPCVGNESVIHFEGENTDTVHPGIVTYRFPPTGDIWTECGTDKSMDPAEVQFACPAAEAANTSGMGFYFRSGTGTTIGIGVYEATALSA